MLSRLASPKFIKRMHLFLLSVACKYGILGDCWYLISGGFRREHKATLYGRYLHKMQLAKNKDSGAIYTLRRNTHRLEKGLIMRPRRKVFGLSFIAETVRIYKALVQNKQTREANIETLEWSSSVLASYFDCTDSDNQILRTARKKFESSSGLTNETLHLCPYRRDLTIQKKINVEDLHELAIQRRSCRWFKQKQVPRTVIDKAIEIGTLAPSACNRQPFEIFVYDDPKIAKEIGAIPGGTVGFSENFPCLFVFVGDMSAFYLERDRHLPYIDSSLAAMGIQFALEVQGVSSCCINWPDIEHREREITKVLGLEIHQRVIMLLAVGYPDDQGMVPYSQKKPLDQIRKYNRYAD